MHTPAGKECRFYHQDFHRGRNVQECRLIRDNPESLRWQPVDCTTCPVPDILRANASKYLEIKLTVKSRFLGLGRQKDIEVRCTRHGITLDDPYVGCPQCHEERPGLEVFQEALRQIDHK